MSERSQNKSSIRYSKYDAHLNTISYRSDGPSKIYMDGTLSFYENGKYSGLIDNDGHMYSYNSSRKESFAIDRWGRKHW